MNHLHRAEVKHERKLHLFTLPVCLRGLHRVNFTLENNKNNNGAPRHCCASSCSLFSCGFCVSSLALNQSETLIRNRSCCCCRVCLTLRAYVHRNGPMISPCTSYCAARSEMQLDDALEPAVVSNVSRIELRQNPS